MKKILLTFGIFFGIIAISIGQQQPQFTQFQLNDFIINPAIAGSRNYFEAKSSNRYQWEGIQDAPRTFTLGVNGPIQNQKMGVGGFIFVDVTGPTRRTGFNLAYAYHINLNDNIKLSMAINAGLEQYSLDGNEIRLEDESDQVYANASQSTFIPDAGFSFYIYDDNFYFGGAAPQLIQSTVSFEETPEKGTGRLANHYYLMGGYKYDVSSSFQLEPGFLLKYVDPVPMQYEFTLKAMYNEVAWVGASYRSEDAIALLFGLTLNKVLTFGYSYDLIQSNLANYSTGSHEFMVGLRFYGKNDPAVVK